MKEDETKLTRNSFLAACRKNRLLSAVLAHLNIEVNSELLVQKGIMPKANGAYTSSQVIDLYNKLAPEGLARLKNAGKEEKNSEAKIFTHFIKGIRGLENSSELKHFLLLLLSSKFIEEMRAMRLKYGMPSEGFSSEEEVAEWAGLKDVDYPKPLATSLAVGETEEETKKLSKNARSLRKVLDPALYEIMKAYGLGLRVFAMRIYLFHGMHMLTLLQRDLNIMRLKPKLDVITPTQRFHHHEGEWHDSMAEMEARSPNKSKEGIPFKDRIMLYYPTLERKPKNFFIAIQVNSPVLTKEDLIDFFDKHFEQVKNEFEEFRPGLIPSGEFGRHWLTYLLKARLKIKLFELNELLREAQFKAVTSANSRVITSRVSKDIQMLERYKKV